MDILDNVPPINEENIFLWSSKGRVECALILGGVNLFSLHQGVDLIEQLDLISNFLEMSHTFFIKFGVGAINKESSLGTLRPKSGIPLGILEEILKVCLRQGIVIVVLECFDRGKFVKCSGGLSFHIEQIYFQKIFNLCILVMGI